MERFHYFAYRASTILYKYLVQSKTEEWILPANICYIVPMVFLKAKKNISFVDIDPVTFLIDENKVYDIIRIKSQGSIGVLFNHTYGCEINQDFFFNNLKSLKHDINIIDDKCLCLPRFDEEESKNADLILYSTGYSKYVDLGIGGYGFSKQKLNFDYFDYDVDDEKSILNIVKKTIEKGERPDINLFNQKWLNSYELELEIPHYVGMVRTEQIRIAEHKRKINLIYENNLPIEIQLNTCFQQWRFNIIVNGRDLLLKQIFFNKLFASSHYHDLSGILMNQQAKYSFELHSKVINLFNDKYISENQALKLTRIIRKYLKL